MTWEALREAVTLDRASFLLAFAALAVAIHSARQSRRNADAAERSARAAEAQSEAAQGQSQTAKEQAAEARIAAAGAERSVEAAHVSVLEAARGRIDSLAPKAIIAVESVPWPPRLKDFSGTDGRRERAIDDLPMTLTFNEDRFLRIFFTVRGVVINDGSHSMRVSSDGPDFVKGHSPILEQDLKIPPTVDPAWMEVLLRPGEAALFEWKAGMMFERWVNRFEDPSKEPNPSARFVFSPGSKEKYLSTVQIELDVEPIEPVNWDAVSRRENFFVSQWKIPRFSHTRVLIGEPIRRYPEDVDRLKSQLMPTMRAR